MKGSRVARRGEPLQYVTGEMPFRHIVLKCAPGVLIPRPETEILVDEVLAYVDARLADEPPVGPAAPVRVLEVGVGTGCVSLSIASERVAARVTATDISPDAVALATRNAEALGLADRVAIIQTDLVDGVPGADEAAFDVLVSNPPYIPTAQLALLPREVGGYEPGPCPGWRRRRPRRVPSPARCRLARPARGGPACLRAA